MPSSSCLKWHGGKSYLANWIVSLMPRHLNYVEPYFGGGAVLFARDPDDEQLWLPPHRGVSEVVNDLNGMLSRFWNVLACEVQFPRFLRIVQAMPFSGVLWEECRDILEGPVGCDDEACAAAYFFVLNRQSLAGRMKGFTGITRSRTRARMNNEVSAWLSAIDGLSAVHDRLKRVLVLPPQTALDVIRKMDTPETFFYVDPPYLHETRATTTEYGAFEMTKADHERLLFTLGTIEGKFLLSGYRSILYDDFSTDAGWNRHDKEIVNQASGARVKEVKTECLWANY